MVGGLTQRDAEIIKEVLQGFPELKDVRVFGSRALGTYKPGSDLDLVIMDPQLRQSGFVH